MNSFIQKTTVSCLVSLSLFSLTVPSSYAVENNETPKVLEKISQPLDVYQSKVIIVNDNASNEILEVENSQQKIGDILTTYNKNIENYHIDSGEDIDANKTLENNTSFYIYKNVVQSDVKNVSISFNEKIEYSEDVEKGVSYVKQEGINGEAIETLVEVKRGNEIKYEKTLNIIKAPVLKIIVEGTKEKIVEQPVIEPVVREEVVPDNVLTPQEQGVSGLEVSTTLNNISDNEIVSMFSKHVGKDYVWGDEGPNTFDCSGLIYYVYNTQLGWSIPRVAIDQGKASVKVDAKDIKPGDILWTTEHIGVYAGNGKVIHAANPVDGVVVSDLSWFLANGFEIGRFPESVKP